MILTLLKHRRVNVKSKTILTTVVADSDLPTQTFKTHVHADTCVPLILKPVQTRSATFIYVSKSIQKLPWISNQKMWVAQFKKMLTALCPYTLYIMRK